jgi:MFS family permease
MRAPIAERHTARGWTPFAAGVFAIVALLLGSNLPNPLFPLYAKTFGLSPLDITLVFATYTLLVIPALILLAPLSDAKGRRLLFSGSIVVAAVAAGLFAAATDAAWLYAAQAVQAFALGALQGTAAPALVESDPSENVRRSAAIASAATLAGAALGPLLAGLLAQYGPLSPRLPYLIEIALLLCALGAARLLPEARERHRYRPRRPEIPREIRRRFGLASVSAFVGWAVTGLYLALIPSFVTTVLHHDLASAGAVLALMLAASAITAAFSHRLPSLPTQLTGMVTMGLSVALLVGAAELRSLGILLVATVTAGTGQGLTFMGSLADVNEMAPPDRKANTVAGYYVVVYLGTALPVIGVGALAGPLGLISAIDVFAAVVLVVCLAGIAALVMERWGRPVVSAS